MSILDLKPICESQAHCIRCRDLLGGRQWRTSLATFYSLPGGVIDFDCPEGKCFNAEPGSERGKAAEPPAILAKCRTCDNFSGQICELQFPKGCCWNTWQKFIQEGVCPMALPKCSSTA